MSEVVVRKRAYIVGLVISIVIMLIYELNGFLIGGYGPAWSYVSTGMGAYLWALPIFLLVAGVSSKLLKSMLSRQELTIIYTMILATCLMGVIALSTIGSAFLVTSPDYDEVRQYFSEVIYSFPTNIIYWSAFVLSMYGCIYFGVLIWRKEYVDTEVLPFPTMIPALRTVESLKGQRSIFNKLFIIGLLIGLVSESLWTTAPTAEGRSLISIFINKVLNVPGFTMPSTPFVYDLKQMFGLTNTIPLITWIPWLIGLHYLLPTRVLLTAWTAGFIFTILMPPILILANIIPSLPPDTTSGIMYWSWMYGPQISISLGLGGLFALGLVPYIIKWRYVLNTLRGIGSEMEPMPYRRMWLCFLICLIVWSALMSITGIPFWVSLVIAICSFVWYMGWNRLYGEAYQHGFLWIANFSEYFGGLPSFFWGGTMNSLESRMAMYFGITVVDTVQGSELGLNFLGPFSMAKLTGTRSKDVHKAILLSLMIGLPIAIATGMMYMNIFGFGGHKEDLDWPAWASEGPWFAYMAAVNLHVTTFIAGVIVVGIIIWLSETYPWFILSPAGIVLASGHYFLGTYAPGIWFTALLAWIIKMVLLRVGGTEAARKYESLFIGIIVGYTIIILVTVLLVRIYYPATLPKWW